MIEAKVQDDFCELNASGDLETLARDLAGLVIAVGDVIGRHDEAMGMFFRKMVLQKLMTTTAKPLSETVTSFLIKGGERHES